MAKTKIEQINDTLRAVAFLLQYPGDNWEDGLGLISEAIANNIPEVPAEHLNRFIKWARTVGQISVEQQYVQTFDQKRRCCLELSYYTTGDTRQRGIALTIFQDLYAAVGWELTGENLPDYLPYLLELAAATDSEDRQLVDNIISTHRSGIEVLEQALLKISSPWSYVIAALEAVLPEIDRETEKRILDLIKTGPPAELVGRDTQGKDARRVFLSSAAALAATMTAKPEVK